MPNVPTTAPAPAAPPRPPVPPPSVPSQAHAHIPPSVRAAPPAPPLAPTPAPPSGPTERELELSGAVENFKRRLRSLEEENRNLRAKFGTARSQAGNVGQLDQAVTALRSDLAAARSATLKAENRAELAEYELKKLQEQSEYVEATQLPIASQHMGAVRGTPARASQGTPARASQATQGFSMNRSTPRPKRRRTQHPPQAQTPPSDRKRNSASRNRLELTSDDGARSRRERTTDETTRSRRERASDDGTRSRKDRASDDATRTRRERTSDSGRRERPEEERDDADWTFQDGLVGFLQTYDEPAREEARVRTAVCTPERAQAMTNKSTRHTGLRLALGNVLAGGGSWAALQEAIVEAGGKGALETAHVLQIHAGTSGNCNPVKETALNAIRAGSADVELGQWVLASGSDAAEVLHDPAVARTTHDALVAGNDSAAALTAALARAALGKDDVGDVADRLAAAALGAATARPNPSSRFASDALAAAEAARQPAVYAHALPLLDSPAPHAERAARLVAEAGAPGTMRAAAMRAVVALGDRDGVWAAARARVLGEWARAIHDDNDKNSKK